MLVLKKKKKKKEMMMMMMMKMKEEKDQEEVLMLRSDLDRGEEESCWETVKRWRESEEHHRIEVKDVP